MDATEKRIRESFARQGVMTTFGAEMARVRPGETEIRFPFRASLTQQDGFLHAGVVTTVMDSACGYAALSVAPAGVEVLAVEFKANFIRPAAGDAFVARAQVKRSGKRLTVCTADAFAINDGEEKLIATMLATMMYVPLEKG